ncbi:MAG: LOG family protein [Leptospira sp.]|nr:LOG family protein [Leptospira sp.]
MNQMTTMPSTQIYPTGTLNTLSKKEMERITKASGLAASILRDCALAVLNSGEQGDDAESMFEKYKDFQIEIHEVNRGIRLDLANAPLAAFVDGKMIRGIRELLSAVIRDITYYHSEIKNENDYDETNPIFLTNSVYELLRNAMILNPSLEPNLVVCWGGHSIARPEYQYTKTVGYQLGLRGLDICTGCGPGAMKGPMKGATFGHAKQRTLPGRYIGVTEPGIIAAESPNPIVNQLVILPDIEKRLEAFVRIAHGIIVFPGGAGTAEEILYILGLLLQPENQNIKLPLVFTGPKSAEKYFQEIHQFIRFTLGDEAANKYTIIIDDPIAVSKFMSEEIEKVKESRIKNNESFYFNWNIKIPLDFQIPFVPNHENMASLELKRSLPKNILAANLRKVFSGIVTGNIKAHGVQSIRDKGPFQISGELDLMKSIDKLLTGFVEAGRMKMGTSIYKECYTINASI